MFNRIECHICSTDCIRAPDKGHIFIYLMLISSPNPVFDHLLESSHRDDSNEWSNIGFGEEIAQVESLEINCTYFIWSSDIYIHKNLSSGCYWYIFTMDFTLRMHYFTNKDLPM